MQKKYKENLEHKLETMENKRLEEVKDVLEKWEYNHVLKKKSWFWHDNGDMKQREWKSSKYTFSEGVVISDVEIRYRSNCSMSRQHVYWSDGLYVKGDKSIHVDFADVDFLVYTIGEILKSRKMKD